MNKITGHLAAQKTKTWLVGLIFFASGLVVAMLILHEIRQVMLASAADHRGRTGDRRYTRVVTEPDQPTR